MNYNNSSLEAYLSTSGLVLICGEAALAGEKLGLYRPDMAFFPFSLSAFLREFEQTKEWNGKKGFCCSCCRRKRRNKTPSIKGVCIL